MERREDLGEVSGGPPAPSSPPSRPFQVARGDAAAGGGREHPAVLQTGLLGLEERRGGPEVVVVPGTGGGDCRSLLSSHKGIPSVLTQNLLVFFRGMLRSEGRGGRNYCLALSESSPFYKKRSDVESLSDPIKVKGGHLLAWLKGINGFYGIHRGMQIEALWQVWWQQIEIIDPFVSEGRAQWAAFLLHV